jgi:S-adenosylmethionine:tRNA ribosyltransferase-isomerase
VRVADFDFELPIDRIAQFPSAERDGSRLMVLNRQSQGVEHQSFFDIVNLLQEGDVLVMNDSRVIPARLMGRKMESPGQVELLLLEETQAGRWWSMVRPGKRVRPGMRLQFGDPATGLLVCEVLDKNPEGHILVQWDQSEFFWERLLRIGQIPLPPYIERGGSGASDHDAARYQTIYNRQAGSVAAPTAGLHFTKRVMQALEAKGVRLRYVTLHVGAGTFLPVKAEAVSDHTMHEERYELGIETAQALNEAKASGRRVISVGTTSMRVLETVAARAEGLIQPGSGRTRIFIHPPHVFRVVDALLTNFHLPKSTLLMLVSAFADPGGLRGRDFVMAAYAEAIREKYRFFSYGDAMFLH